MTDDQRAQLFCLVPAERADVLLEPLSDHFAVEPRVSVMVDRRTGNGARREQKQGRSRAPVAERDAARALPPELRPHARHVRLVQPMEPVGRTYEDAPMADLIERSSAADADASSELWWRVSARVLARLRLAIGVFATERATSQILGRLLDELPGYDAGEQPLDAWLDRVVDRFCAERLPAA